jgi:hypothetical protein
MTGLFWLLRNERADSASSPQLHNEASTSKELLTRSDNSAYWAKAIDAARNHFDREA